MSEEPRPRRRPRYAGAHPRRYEEKYKEHAGDGETLAKVAAAGKTPAGAHRPIMVAEILDVLKLRAGAFAVDCTLGHGGHAVELLAHLQPGGRLLGLDADPIELPRTEARLRALGFDEAAFIPCRSNFAGLRRTLDDLGVEGADAILADLGVSSMQLDNPARGFTFKDDGPLDMRMNPQRGQPAGSWLVKTSAAVLARALADFADEPHAAELAQALAGCHFTGTLGLARAIRALVSERDADATVRRVFQTLRIAVNDELGALDAWLAQLPACLLPGGRVAVLTFHSGEDRRVKHAFRAGLDAGIFAEISHEVTRATPEEQRANPRSSPAKLRWAIRATR